MIIESALKRYDVTFFSNGRDKVQSLLEIKNVFWVVDKKVYDLYASSMLQNIPNDKLILIEALETQKNISTALQICEAMTELPEKRNATLVSIGGGIIQDITGFSANILYRGIHWVYIPTTLLASCDSCIGGKTSLNYKTYKNLLGTFFPPEQVCICPEFFKTLSEKDYLSGLGEVIKFNIMAGAKRLDKIIEDMPQILDRVPQTVEDYVHTSLVFKKNFIEIDEFDRGERIKLNFAHTFGHAFETLSHYEIPHGTAVAMGMIVANNISYMRNLIDKKLKIQMEELLCQIIKIDLKLISGDEENLIGAIKKDKKQVGESITAVLIHKDMSLEIVNDVTREEILKAIIDMKEILA